MLLRSVEGPSSWERLEGLTGFSKGFSRVPCILKGGTSLIFFSGTLLAYKPTRFPPEELSSPSRLVLEPPTGQSVSPSTRPSVRPSARRHPRLVEPTNGSPHIPIFRHTLTCAHQRINDTETEMQFFSDESRVNDKWALPDCEVFELTAQEVAEQDAELIRCYMRKPKFRLAAINSRVREAMFQQMIDDGVVSGGWFYHYCLPGCLPDSSPFGPFETRSEAIADAAANLTSC